MHACMHAWMHACMHTWRYIKLHYVTLHYITFALHYICITLHYITSHYITYIHTYSTIHYITVIALRCIALQDTTWFTYIQRHMHIFIYKYISYTCTFSLAGQRRCLSMRAWRNQSTIQQRLSPWELPTTCLTYQTWAGNPTWCAKEYFTRRLYSQTFSHKTLGFPSQVKVPKGEGKGASLWIRKLKNQTPQATSPQLMDENQHQLYNVNRGLIHPWAI